jgi:hypothetical protein
MKTTRPTVISPISSPILAQTLTPWPRNCAYITTFSAALVLLETLINITARMSNSRATTPPLAR